jgi:hypothetical protein
MKVVLSKVLATVKMISNCPDPVYFNSYFTLIFYLNFLIPRHLTGHTRHRFTLRWGFGVLLGKPHESIWGTWLWSSNESAAKTRKIQVTYVKRLSTLSVFYWVSLRISDRPMIQTFDCWQVLTTEVQFVFWGIVWKIAFINGLEGIATDAKKTLRRAVLASVARCNCDSIEYTFLHFSSSLNSNI